MFLTSHLKDGKFPLRRFFEEHSAMSWESSTVTGKVPARSLCPEAPQMPPDVGASASLTLPRRTSAAIHPPAEPGRAP